MIQPLNITEGPKVTGFEGLKCPVSPRSSAVLCSPFLNTKKNLKSEHDLLPSQGYYPQKFQQAMGSNNRFLKILGFKRLETCKMISMK
jgi:hypothetical protein